jgi:hypothetical protein
MRALVGQYFLPSRFMLIVQVPDFGAPSSSFRTHCGLNFYRRTARS